jgi:hypothetical protein
MHLTITIRDPLVADEQAWRQLSKVPPRRSGEPQRNVSSRLRLPDYFQGIRRALNAMSISRHYGRQM